MPILRSYKHRREQLLYRGRYSPFEIPNIPAVVVDIPIDGFLGKYGELDALVLHVRRHLYAAKNVRLANLVELDCVAAAPHFFPMLDSSDFETYPPNV